MNSKISNIVFAIFWLGTIIGMMIYSSSLYDQKWDLEFKVDSLRSKVNRDSLEISFLKNNPDTVKITTSREYSFEMDGKVYSMDEYIELFNRLYVENEFRKDSLRVWKHNLKTYENSFEKMQKEYKKDIDTLNQYITDYNYYKTKYDNLQRYLDNNKILYKKNDTLVVADDQELLRRLRN